MQLKLTERELQKIVADHLNQTQKFGEIKPEQITFTHQTHGQYDDMEFSFDGAVIELPADTHQ